ncbi:MAG TPA: PAS domain-containing sensor histidine kinase [Polyangiaceae bacterium]|nr:PAS domain-containing sensor histidine kinase [Polyangiaceae bacterium]
MAEGDGEQAVPSHAESETAERFRLLIESVKDYAIFILDPDGRVSTWNAGAERIKGYRAAEIVGKHFSIFYPSEVSPAEKCRVELEIAAEEGRFEEEGWRLRKDGSRLWANVIITALRNPAGQLIGFAKVTQDLTRRRAAEEETRRFRLLVESVKDYAIFILDPTGHVSTWNPGAQRIKGYSSGEIIGKHFSIFYPPESHPERRCELELELASQEGRFEEEGWRVRKDGSRFWAKVTITTLRDSTDTVLGFAKVTQDLTQRRETEAVNRALAEQRAALAEKARIQEFQERFLAILGHDLRNPLASIDMGLGILREQSNDPAASRILDRMRSSSGRMTRMIEQILDLTRSRLAGGLEVTLRPMDLRESLTKIVEELRTAHPERSLDFTAQSMPIVGDPDRLEQVFSNLIGNAILHGDPARPVVVRAGLEDELANVSVHNEGEPIPADIQDKIFDPFRRGERESRTAKTAGLGLGLYISWEIVRGHHGSIEVDSSAERGTTFRLKIPTHPPGER